MKSTNRITICKRRNYIYFSSENTNHLGNVLAVITDAWYTDSCIDEIGVRYGAHITQATDYSAFGAPLPGRTWYSTASYRMGFNSEEHENNLYASGMAYDLGARWYDSRLGRMFSRDPLAAKYMFQSPYAYCGNSPIWIVDVNGAGDGDKAKVQQGQGVTQYLKANGVSASTRGGWISLLDGLAKANPSRFGNYNENWGEDKKWKYWNNTNVDFQWEVGDKLNLPGTDNSQNNQKKTSEEPTPTSGSGIDDKLYGATHIQGVLALTQSTIENLGGLDKAKKLLAGKFEVLYNGSLKTWSLKFYGNQTVDATFVQVAKEGFRAETLTKVPLLKCVKAGGAVINVLGVVTAGMDIYYNGWNVGNTSDLVFSGVAFVPGWGWVASGSYYYAKYVAYPMYIGNKTFLEKHPLEGHPENLIYHICFKSGTLVNTKKGLISIENLEVGDSIYSWNIDENKLEVSIIEKTYNNTTTEIYRITTKSNKTIHVTGEHPFFVLNKGWTKVKDLRVNYELKLQEYGGKTDVLGIEMENREEIRVYNIEVSKNHNYFITNDKILVHNKSIVDVK